MRLDFLKLEKVLNLKKWQILQDSLAALTKLAIITVDHLGIPITAHSGIRPFCHYVRSIADLERLCHKSDSRAGLEAVRINKPYIYLCHCEIVDVAIPIAVDNRYVGALMAGQVRLPLSEANTPLEQTLTPSTSLAAFGGSALQQMYDEIPILSYEEIQTSARLLFDLCHYVVEEAMSKNMVMEMYERILPQKKEPTISYPLEGQFNCKNDVLKPAFNHIFSNIGDNFNLKKLADLCYISTSHFSRLFAKETGVSLSDFVARQKIEWSKQLLQKTELSISEISDELGFSDVSYYIKTFKKYENTTPSGFRKAIGNAKKALETAP
jgi:ligand-binding sensor protein/AraC-like DNA-binding protein